MSNKVTLVMGASVNPERYSNMAIIKLLKYGYEVVGVGNREGEVNGVHIHTGKPHFNNIDTITMYLGPHNQANYYDYILSLKPRRIIFNPGAENSRLKELAKDAGIQVVEACTLVLLSIGNY